MSASSREPSAKARIFVQRILQRVANVKNQVVAEAIGKDESNVSRIVSGEIGIKLSDLHSFLDALSLKVVDRNQVCIDVDEYNAMLILTQRAMAAKKPIEPKEDE